MVVGLIASLIAVITVLHRVVQGGRTPQLRALGAGAVFSFVASLVRVPDVSALLVFGGVNVTWPLENILGMLCLYLMLCYMHFTVDASAVAARQMLRHLTALLGAGAILVFLFALAPHSREFDFGPQGRYTAGGSPDTVVGPIAWLILAVYLIYPLQDLTRVSLRWARKAASIRWLSIALGAYALGAFISAAVQLHVLVYQVALLVPDLDPLPWPEASVEGPPLAVAGVGTMVGLCATGVYSVLMTSPRLRPVRELLHHVQLWWQYRVACCRLYPLWSTLWQALPSVALSPARSRIADCLRLHATWNLHRRIIELADFLQAFRRYVSADVGELAERLARERGLDGDDVAAVVDAVVLAVGSEAYLAKRPMPDSVVDVVARRHAVSALDHEARHWLLVSAMRFGSPVVPEVLNAVRERVLTAEEGDVS
ncbi:MAB_1171c family putative transporter [Kutzneria sp. CA-103260]|uniref:MAB_1171c family putative transporter n=1 Tax=Kutzneria sp. CA-103260 TaxID=2802641 RepID=UPI001BAD9663|nr:MAB_1171c family putative transporter [Kutzneria sp. CA-103260]